MKNSRITELEKLLEQRLDNIARGASHYPGLSITSGSATLCGRHVTVSIPVDRFHKSNIPAVLSLFEDLYADIYWVRLSPQQIERSGENGRLYRELLLGLDRQTYKGAEILR
jgi:hypothetical protein